MKTVFHIFSFESKILWRSNTLKVLLLVVLGAGIYGIYFGRFEIDQQKTRIAQVQEHEQEQFEQLLAWAKLDTTVAANKELQRKAVAPAGKGHKKHFTYYLSHEVPHTAGLCLGQRDLFPIYYGITVSDLARQLNTGELANPMKLLTGNFDLSYVFVFLFPLLVVVLLYNLHAGEKEGGTLSLLESQSTSLSVILFSKGLLRATMIWGLATLLLLLGFWLQGLSLLDHGTLFLQWLGLVLGYVSLWMLFMSFVVWLRMRSTLSAIVGFGGWLVFTTVTPALINLSVSATAPLPNRTELIDVLRNLNGKAWGSPRSFVLNQFYTQHPQYNDGDTTDFGKWYYASFTLLDQKARTVNAAFEVQVKERNALLEQWAWLAPAAMVHEQLAALSKTDRKSHLEFLKEVQAYHQTLKEVYYPRIFSGESFSVEDLQRLQRQL